MTLTLVDLVKENKERPWTLEDLVKGNKERSTPHPLDIICIMLFNK